MAAENFFYLHNSLSKEYVIEAKKKVFGLFDPEDLQIKGSLAVFYNGYYIPASVKLFFNSKKDFNLDFEVTPKDQDLEVLKEKLTEEVWQSI